MLAWVAISPFLIPDTDVVRLYRTYFSAVHLVMFSTLAKGKGQAPPVVYFKLITLE